MEPATIAREMSTATARIAYDGELVRTGLMDVRDLAPALLEFGALCERANNLLNGDQAKISVHVQADFKAGSFAIDLTVIQTIFDHLKASLFGQHAQDAKYIMEWVLGITSLPTSIGVFGLYKMLRGRKALATQSTGDSVTINVTNNTTIIVARQVVELYNDDTLRARIAGSLKPLERNGIDEFQIRGGSDKEPAEIAERISKEEVLEALENRRIDEKEPSEPPVLDSTYPAALEIVKIPFRENLVWNFSMGKAKISAEMKDEAFLERHRSGLTSFSTGDILIVDLRTRSWRAPGSGLRVVHEVIEVKDHIHKAPQLSLDLNEE